MGVKYAGFWRRVGAALLDGVVIGIAYLAYAWFVLFPLMFLFGTLTPTLSLSDWLILSAAAFLLGILDGCLVLVAPIVVILMVLMLYLGKGAWDACKVGFLLYGILFVLNWFYHAFMESSSNQATLGKMLLKIRVTDMSGHRISFRKATVRHFSKILSSILLCARPSRYAAWTKQHQPQHDEIAGCLVVKEEI